MVNETQEEDRPKSYDNPHEAISDLLYQVEKEWNIQISAINIGWTYTMTGKASIHTLEIVTLSYPTRPSS